MMDWLDLIPHLPHLLRGLLITLTVTVGGAVVALVCAFLAGLSRLSQDWLLRLLARVYIEVFRGTSALVQLYWFYFALPILLGIQLNALLVGIVVIGLNVGAYGAEVVRGAIQAIPKGQYQAATALNLSRWQTMRHVILPQACVAMLPPLGNLMIELLKVTSLVSMITVTDLTRAGLNIRDNTLHTTEVFCVLLVVYFSLSLGITAAVRGLERRFPSDWNKENRRVIWDWHFAWQVLPELLRGSGSRSCP